MKREWVSPKSKVLDFAYRLVALVGAALPQISVPSYVARHLNARLSGRNGAVVVDLGCGCGERYEALARMLKFRPISVGVELHAPSAAAAKRVYDDVVLGDVRLLPIRAGSYDVALALDVVEHLEKEEAVSLLRFLKPRVMSIMTTPNGFQPSRECPDNPYQEHKCGFVHDELEALGYRIYGLWGLKRLSAPDNLLPAPVLGAVVTIARLLSQVLLRCEGKPELASCLVAVRNAEPSR